MSPATPRASPREGDTALKSDDRWFDAAGVPIRYVEQGAGEPVVLVHSYTGDLEGVWVRTGVLATIASEFRAIALDLRGHGKSGKPHEPSAYGREMAWDLTRLLDHLGLDRAHFVGYSLGAHIVAQLLTLAPGRFITATLGGASGRRGWSEQDETQAQREADEMERGRLDGQVMRLWPTDRPRPSEAALRRAAAAALAGKDHRALAAVRRANRDQVISTADLEAVHVPVLGIVGSKDPYRAMLEEIAPRMHDLRLVVIEGATHADAPSYPQFAQALMEFLRAHRKRNPR